jgi:hypothetical protein
VHDISCHLHIIRVVFICLNQMSLANSFFCVGQSSAFALSPPFSLLISYARA